MKRTELKRSTKPMKRTPTKRTPISLASPAQKEKVLREGHRNSFALDGTQPDPAHIIPRGLGGCDHEDCVCPLSRGAHRDYDNGKLDLLPYLNRKEQAHAVEHLGLIGALKRITNKNWIPKERG